MEGRWESFSEEAVCVALGSLTQPDHIPPECSAPYPPPLPLLLPNGPVTDSTLHERSLQLQGCQLLVLSPSPPFFHLSSKKQIFSIKKTLRAFSLRSLFAAVASLVSAPQKSLDTAASLPVSCADERSRTQLPQTDACAAEVAGSQERECQRATR
ncbi:hypothetical protein SKAU_G00177380 [Synaphobranchus kaupii]|uniref:Uncharacterized protein n=1 Tax=Synaphobranchus kaupii TaxID=118154 RepID=A0A9Q1FLX9_SYNKA|nr:hypothetical protein SKAU_G00177380 [Synaphobranchus kaupii]